MPYDVEVTCVATGEVRRGPFVLAGDAVEWDPEGDPFWWSDGNFGCDCNRALVFAALHGEPDPDAPCGAEMFRLRCLSPAGEVLYEDEAQR